MLLGLDEISIFPIKPDVMGKLFIGILFLLIAANVTFSQGLVNTPADIDCCHQVHQANDCYQNETNSESTKDNSIEIFSSSTHPIKAYYNIHVVPMDGSERILERQTVLIEDHQIIALGQNEKIAIPEGTYIIDGTAKFLIPGLVDAHVHLRHADTTDLLSYLKAGVTTIREMNGRPFLLDWRKQIEKGALLGPTLYVASPTIGNFSSPREGYPTPTTIAQVDSTINRFAEQGYDWIKVYTFLPSDMFIPIIEAAARHGIPVGGHPPLGISFDDMLKMKSIEHLLGYLDPLMTKEAISLDEEDMRGVFHAVDYDKEGLIKLAQKTNLAGVWNCPTILFFDHRVPTERVRKAWEQPHLRKLGHENRVAIVKALHEAGADLVVGTDSDAGDDLPAEAIHEELANMLEAGMSAYQVLNAATNKAAEFLGGQSEFGTISVGKRADLIMLEHNPFEDLSSIKSPIHVMSRGNLIVLIRN